MSQTMPTNMDKIPFNVLCVEPDTGFRCLISLLILDDIIARVSRLATSRRLPIRHIFDLVGGEGSGGIVALLIGRLNLSRVSAPELLQDMGPRFCPWGGAKRRAGVHKSHPFVADCSQPRFCRLDEEAAGEAGKVFYSKESVRTCVLASLEGMPEERSLSKKIKGWVKGVVTAARVLPIRLYSHLKLGPFYTKMAFQSEKVTNPIVSSSALKERFRSYDPTISRSNVYISDIAQATFTHDNLVAPKTINGRRYADKKKSTNIIFDILDEANACFPDRNPGVVIRIGGDYLKSLSAPSLGRTGLGDTNRESEFGFLERVPKTDNFFQITLPEVKYEVELIDDPDKVYEVFEDWIKKQTVVDMMERCALALFQSVGARAKHFPGDTVKDFKM